MFTKIKSHRSLFSFRKQKQMCFDAPSPMSSTCKHLVYLERLMDYITYGFFESNKNRTNQKSASNTKKQNKKNSIPVCDRRHCPVRPVRSVSWLNVCTAQVKSCPGLVAVWLQMSKQTSSRTQNRCLLKPSCISFK